MLLSEAVAKVQAEKQAEIDRLRVEIEHWQREYQDACKSLTKRVHQGAEAVREVDRLRAENVSLRGPDGTGWAERAMRLERENEALREAGEGLARANQARENSLEALARWRTALAAFDEALRLDDDCTDPCADPSCPAHGDDPFVVVPEGEEV